MKIPFALLLFLICLVMSGFEAKAEDQNDSLPEKEKIEMKTGIRFSPSLNFLDYGDFSFGQIASDYKVGAALGMVFDWEISQYNRFRLEPYLENTKTSTTTLSIRISKRSPLLAMCLSDWMRFPWY